MAQWELRQEDLKALEQTRQRLFQLTSNIDSLKQDILRSNPLPQWSSLQTSAAILGNNIKTLTDHLSTHSDLLSRTVVYPQTNYPGRTQENLLGQLLRKKLEPQVESWVEEGRAIAERVEAAKVSGESPDASLEELWKWARDWIGMRVAKYALEEGQDNYTVEERERGIENVNTGLRRRFDEEESSEEEEEDEEMGGTQVKVTSVRKTSVGQVEFGLGELKNAVAPASKPRTMQEILRFATSGVILDEGPNVKR